MASTPDVPPAKRFLLAAEVEGASTKGLAVLDWDDAHILVYFSSADRAQEFADPGAGGVPQGPGVNWRSVELSPGEILYLLDQSDVRVDEVLEDPLPVAMDYPTAPLDIFVDRLELESKQTAQPIEGYAFFVT